jgi:DNA polymerase-3 subunit epsilon
VEYDESENTLLSFTSYMSARERIEQWIEEYELCLRYCHLTGDESICFNHQIKKCRGICAGDEEVNSYNKRAQEIISQIVFKDEHFALIDHGRHKDERSIILVENSHFVGFGQLDSTCSFSSIDDCRSFITKRPFYPDADDLIKGFLKNNRLKTIVFRS